MINQPSPEVQQRLRAMCVQLSVAQNLDEEIRRELYGHMEDKLLAYLNGEEMITEEDALILVRGHFGDPAIIKGLLHTAHPIAAGSYFLRRAAMLLCAEMALVVLAGRCTAPLLDKTPLWYPAPHEMVFMTALIPSLVRLPFIGLLYVSLRLWQRAMNAGRYCWFLRQPGWAVGLLCTAVLAAGLGLRSAQLSVPITLPPTHSMWVACTLALSGICGMATALIWIWWCDSVPRLRRPILAACGLWGALEFALMFPPLVWTLHAFRHVGQGYPEGFFTTYVPGYFQNGFLLLVVSGLCAMTAYAALHGIMRHKAKTT